MYFQSNYNPNLLLSESKSSYQDSISQKTKQWVEILVDCPGIQGLYTYRLPEETKIRPGDIVSIPFGYQIIGGIVIRLTENLPGDLNPEKIKNIEEVVNTGFFPETYWQLLEKISQYYSTELITVIKTALPPGLLGKSSRRYRLKLDQIPTGAEAFLSKSGQEVLNLLKSQKEGDYSSSYISRQIKGANRGIRELQKKDWLESYLQPPKTISPKLQKAVTLVTDKIGPDLTKRQIEVLQILKHRGGELWLNQLLQICNTSNSLVETLKRKGYVVIEAKEKLRFLEEEAVKKDQPKQLNHYQSKALETINSIDGFSEILLHGITGSGKTEVYLQAIAPILEQGKSALVLIPEIGLTPQLTDRFRARFGNKICVYHSALSTGERYDTWRSMLQGESLVVIGTRSAIFIPLSKLGIIILDEEHDSSFKQNQPVPTYHARTVATWRAKLEKCPLILGSATPSLETWVKIKENQDLNQNKYYLSLPERVQSRPLPQVEIVDLRKELQQGNRSIFSRSLANALKKIEEENKQGILFITRRGHSTFVSCRSCGYVIECPHCDVSLSYHYTHKGATELLRCHYCNHSMIHPKKCPECDSPYLKFFGTGTQRVTQSLEKEFPNLSYIRFDSDTTRTKGSHRTLLTRFAKGEAHLLVGTQMLTKGIDIPGITLVGVLAADGLLHRSDYCASEKAFQILTQVAGRAGRGEDPGQVIIQTYSAEHPVIQAVKNHDYLSFTQAELQQREELKYPPYGSLILIKLSGIDGEQVRETAETMADTCKNIFQEQWEILGPAPANIIKIADRYRWQILLKSVQVQDTMPDFKALRSLCPKYISMTIDVDPLNID